MKQLALALGLIFGMNFILKAAELRPQYRVWKSSYLDTASYTDVLLASAPIIVHAIDISSATTGISGLSFIAMYSSTGTVPNLFRVDFATKIFCALDLGVSQAVQHIYDLGFTSMTYYNKQGIGRVNILWDWMVNDGSPNKAAHSGD